MVGKGLETGSGRARDWEGLETGSGEFKECSGKS